MINEQLKEKIFKLYDVREKLSWIPPGENEVDREYLTKQESMLEKEIKLLIDFIPEEEKGDILRLAVGQGVNFSEFKRIWKALFENDMEEEND